jgi:hypothetical protein
MEENMTKRFRFVSPGEVVVGVVRGVGDKTVSTLKQLEVYQKVAQTGYELSCHEPKPGHVSVYSEYTEGNPGPFEAVDLRNPELKILELVEGGEPVLKIGEIVFRDSEEEMAVAA